MSTAVPGGQAVDVFFWVQHLLGIGHLTRAATLVRAMRRAGLQVTLASGGMPVADLDLAGAELLQLEPLQSDGFDFKILLDAEGRVVDDAFKNRRRDTLVTAFEARRPRLLMIEMFPFGRRQLRFELLPLIAAAKAAVPRPLIVGSVRDILVRQPRPDRLVEMLGWAEDFDRLLVHGDPDLVPFSRTFPARDRLGDRLVETGYVVEPPPLVAAGGDGEGKGEIIVSTGGGRVGQRLMEVALEAAERLAVDADRSATERLRWRLLVGHGVAEETVRALNARAVAGLVVERARSDFSLLLGRAALSISQGGYNTVMEVLAAGCPAIIVPFAGGEEAEQTLRARLLAARGFVLALDEASVDAESLARAVTGLLGRGRIRSERQPRMDGAAYTARLLGQLLAQPDPRFRV